MVTRTVSKLANSESKPRQLYNLNEFIMLGLLKKFFWKIAYIKHRIIMLSSNVMKKVDIKIVINFENKVFECLLPHSLKSEDLLLSQLIFKVG